MGIKASDCDQGQWLPPTMWLGWARAEVCFGGQKQAVCAVRVCLLSC